MKSPESQPSEQSTFRRLRRLSPYVKAARWQFVVGALAGLVFAAASGVGLPVMMYVVAPVIFGSPKTAATSPTGGHVDPSRATVASGTNSSPQSLVQTPPVTSGTETGQLKQKQDQIEKWAKWLFGADYQDKLLLVACLGLPFIFLVRGVSAFLNRYYLNYAGFLMLEALRKDVFNRLQQLPLAYYQKHKSGDLTSRLMTDTEQLKNMVVMISADVIKQPLTLIGAVGTLLVLAFTHRSAVFMLIALVSVPVCVLPMRMAARRLMKKSRLLNEQTGDLTAVVTESLQSPMEIQAYNLQKLQEARFMNQVRSIFRLAMKRVKYQSFVNPAIEFVSACGFMVALYYGVRHGMEFKVFSSLGLALYMAYEPVKKIGNLHALAKMGSTSLERLQEILDAEDTVPPPVNPRSLPGRLVELGFDNVSFNYAARKESAADSPALVDVNVSIRPGEVVALVGPSGAGKSTFVALIPRFYDPTVGRVTLGNVNLREVDKTALREKIAIVPQMPVLFNASIADNIRVGRAAASVEAVRDAARQAFVHEFIQTLPQGYETVVGERGALLSGGQRQRLALARAFLKDAPILILDEAMSALDSESEAMIHEALLKLVQGRTTLMIAHRFSSIGLATRVLVFEDGHITGDGVPAELAKSHPLYRRMCELQRLG